MNGHDFKVAVRHAESEVRRYRQLAAIDPTKFTGHLHSAEIALESLALVAEYDCQHMIFERIKLRKVPGAFGEDHGSEDSLGLSQPPGTTSLTSMADVGEVAS